MLLAQQHHVGFEGAFVDASACGDVLSDRIRDRASIVRTGESAQTPPADVRFLRAVAGAEFSSAVVRPQPTATSAPSFDR
jgi:hypothetical protein